MIRNPASHGMKKIMTIFQHIQKSENVVMEISADFQIFQQIFKPTGSAIAID